jgi:hypothetical protein
MTLLWSAIPARRDRFFMMAGGMGGFHPKKTGTPFERQSRRAGIAVQR